jgi:type II secretory pathway pseudopilin PulG
MNAKQDQAGSTLIEVVFVTALFVSLMASFVSVYNTTSSFSARSSAVLRANEEHQRNLDVIANLLRGAALSSLGNFDASGKSTAPTFQVVTGADAGGNRVLGPVQTLGWRTVGGNVHGVQNPGEVTVTVGGVTTSLASNIPKGGFLVTLSANTLRVTLTTYYSLSDATQTLATTSGDVSVSLRN